MTMTMISLIDLLGKYQSLGMTRPNILMLLHCLNEHIPLILQWAVPMLLVSYKGKGLWISKRFPLHCSRQNTSQTFSE